MRRPAELQDLEPLVPRQGGRPRRELIGQRFGTLTVTGLAGKKDRHVFWEVTCDCGEVHYRPTQSLLDAAKSCRCHRKLGHGEAAKRSLFHTYRRHARKRGLTFDLTLEQFAGLTTQPCFWCGLPPAQVHRRPGCFGDYTYNGLDRKDNALGYTPTNSAPCCWECNRIKRACPLDVFEKWVARLAKHQALVA